MWIVIDYQDGALEQANICQDDDGTGARLFETDEDALLWAAENCAFEYEVVML